MSLLKEAQYELIVTLEEPMLGTVPMDSEVYKKFIESKKPEEEQDEEYKTVETREEKGWTGFHADDKGHFILNHMVKGFLKNGANVLKDKGQLNLPGAKSKVNNFVKVTPRRIRPNISMSGEECATELPSPSGLAPNGLAVLERPLLAQTARGPRVCLARSDVLPAGTTFKCVLSVLDGPIKESTLRKILEYGKYQGLGQWRNAGWGEFSYELKKIDT